MTTEAPCKDCPDRELGCHGRCERYADFKAALSGAAARKIAETAEHYDVLKYLQEKHRRLSR